MSPDSIGFVEAIVIDVADFERAEAFWSQLVGCEFGPSFEPTFRRAHLPSRVALVLQLRPDPKGTRNRVHVDVEVEDIGAALARVEAIGGALVGRVENEFGVHIVCADPDGNEFCLTPQ